jgi:hypothetical protein
MSSQTRAEHLVVLSLDTRFARRFARSFALPALAYLSSSDPTQPAFRDGTDPRRGGQHGRHGEHQLGNQAGGVQARGGAG